MRKFRRQIAKLQLEDARAIGRVPALGLVLLSALLTLTSPSSAAAQPLIVQAWGWNAEGECAVPPGLTNALAVSAGDDFSLALRNNGTVAAWGNNNRGQCNVPGNLQNVTAISAGMQGFALALRSDGTVVGWGENHLGQLNSPAALSNVVAIAAGSSHSLALKSDGTVVAWGDNSVGQIAVPPGLTGVVAIAAHINSMALKGDGTIVAWGGNATGQNDIPPGLSNVVAIATKQHALALKRDGTVVAWGLDYNGEADVPTGLSNVVAIAAGLAHSLALKSDGTLVAWGFNRDGEGSVPAGLSGGVGIAAGAFHNLTLATIPGIIVASQPQSILTNIGATVSFAVTASSGLPLSYQWRKDGTNLAGGTSATLTITNSQTSDAGTYAVLISHPSVTITSTTATLSFTPPPPPVPPTIVTQPKNALAVAGSTASFNVNATGSLPIAYQWRKNGTDLLGQTATNLVIANVQTGDAGSYTVFVSSSFGSTTSAPGVLSLLQPPYTVSSPGTVISLGGPAAPAGLDDIIAIAAGYGQQLAVRSNGTVVAWGTSVSGAQPPAGLSNVVAVSSAAVHSLALKSDGTVVGWGIQATPPAGVFGVVAIYSAHDYSMALKADGTAVGWGLSNPSPPQGNSNYISIALGATSTLGVRSDGTVPVVTGIFNPFPGASNMTAIAAGAGFSPNSFVMLRNDGTLFGWNFDLPAGLSNVVAISPGLALKSDGSVVAIGGSTLTVNLTNVTAIAGGVGNGLVLTRWPAITQPPQSQTVNASTTASFSVVAAGAPPLSYQWRKGGTNINGATGTSLSISNVQPSDAGSYDVVVGNNAGSLASAAATLAVNAFPAIAVPPAPQTLRVGMKGAFTVTATGGQPLAYQWRHNGADISGASATILSLDNAQLSDGGSYAVVVTNTSGSVTSAAAALTVLSNVFTLPIPGTVVGLGGLVVPDGLTNVIAIAAGYGKQLAVRSDGTVASWGTTGFPPDLPPPAGLSNVVAVSSAAIHSAALKSDGTVVCWGTAATPPSGLFGVVAISSAHDYTMALKADGTAVGWGLINPTPPQGNSNYITVAAGGNSCFGVRSDGTVPATSGFPAFPGASNMTAIAAGGGASLNSFVMLRNDGTLFGWNFDLPAGLSNVVAISPGLALKNDGTVVSLSGASVPAGLTNVTAISGSVGNGLALTTNPPPPILSGASGGTSFMLSTPLSVPGYVLEASENPVGPFTIVDGYTNATSTNALTLPASAPGQYYRLRKL